jgi:hypothetical protein
MLTIGSTIAVGRSMQLILSGFSGFGRNFHEERQPPDPPPGDESYDHDAAISGEASRVWAGPGTLFATGVLAAAFRLFPGWMIPDGVADPDFIPYHYLVRWIFIAGFGTFIWAAMILVMMRTGPDRWAYVPGTRERIRSSMWAFLLLGIVLVAVATAFAITSQPDAGSSDGESAVAEAVLASR